MIVWKDVDHSISHSGFPIQKKKKSKNKLPIDKGIMHEIMQMHTMEYCTVNNGWVNLAWEKGISARC